MAIKRVDFNPSTGDDTSAALRILDVNCQDLDDRKLDKSGGVVGGTLAANGKLTAASGTLQVGSDAGQFATMDFSGRLTRNVTSAPSNVSTFVFTVEGQFGGGIRIKDGNNDIGIYSTSGNLCFGYGTNGGALTEQFRMVNGGLMQAKGYQCRNGVSGGYGPNSYNFSWSSGTLTAFVDSSNVGNVQLNTSDYRIKKVRRRITDGADDLALVMAVDPVEWEHNGEGAWEADGVPRRSWLAHELQEASSMLARGEKDATDEEGNIIPQQVDALGVMSVLWGALRRLKLDNDTMAMRLAALEDCTHG
jgi:hypothetical protein